MTLQFDAPLPPDLAGSAEAAVRLEDQGYDGLWIGELRHNPFIQAYEVGKVTPTAMIGTGIAVALARSPMTVAVSAHDLAAVSGGRFVLGLGSQVKAHVERRFSMPWSAPAERMREFIGAVRAIWTWIEMASLISDEILEEFVIISPPELVADRIRQRWLGLADRVTVNYC
ncbi:LLM class flavin-dependent oxidoreductase [Mycolicibacterium fluoranthenivorans]|uniref:LLM class flavin-dependent oxidoreductase n=1 Tax=Mycolicibacterium fluoranthenivorans TaxID=258505 RepID=A0A7G8PGD5_9MYCO|nr:LLM class flavin-dependent oxidoreductase [Mycolicibacterium fluoranthenivorans]QNJ93401.1 LLM class flavin-dependent oxidoreductase [Mycolicibacterium fluoranthenivorans]